MALSNDYDLELLTNEAERMVLEQLQKQLDESPAEVCLCQDCVLDMAAYALNNVKPMYRVSLLGTLYAHSLPGSDYEQSIAEAVRTAIEKISQNPSHA